MLDEYTKISEEAKCSLANVGEGSIMKHLNCYMLRAFLNQIVNVLLRYCCVIGCIPVSYEGDLADGENCKSFNNPGGVIRSHWTFT